MILDEFNRLPETAAREQLRMCCTAERWAALVCQDRPYANTDQLLKRSQQHWLTMEEADYLQAFGGHPKIGDVRSLKKKYAASSTLAAHEQAGMNTASDTVIQALADGNRAYEQKFDFIFIVCASGKTAAQMLELLQKRLGNGREDELKIAVAEQAKITRLRLLQLME